MKKLLVCFGVVGCMAVSAGASFADDGFQGLLDDSQEVKSAPLVQPQDPGKVAPVEGSASVPKPLVGPDKDPPHEWGFWLDYGVSLRKKQSTEPFSSPSSLYKAEPGGNWSLGLGIRLARYFGVRGWYGQANNDYKNTDETDLGLVAPASRSIGKWVDGPVFGYDILFFIPLSRNLTVYGGPGASHYHTIERFTAVDGSVIDGVKRAREFDFTGSAGFSFLPVAQFLKEKAVFSGLTINAGYHTARGVTFGLGAHWR